MEKYKKKFDKFFGHINMSPASIEALKKERKVKDEKTRAREKNLAHRVPENGSR
jgi:hypothetical protein